MAFTQAELETWVKGLGLSEEQQKSVLATFGDEKILPKVGESIMIRSDYSRNMDQLQKEKDKLEADYQAKTEQEDEFHASLTTWKTQKEKETEALLQKAREEAEARLSAIQGKIRDVATRNGIPEEEIKDLLTAPASHTPTRTEPQPRNDDGRFITKDAFKTEAEFYAKLPGMMMSMEREYYRLFGNDATPISWDTVLEKAKANFATSKQPLVDAFNATYKIPEKRDEIAKANHQRDIDEAVKRGEEAARTKLLAEHPELSSRTVTREQPGSPILNLAKTDVQRGKPREGEHGPAAAVSAAVTAFREGKYRPGTAA